MVGICRNTLAVILTAVYIDLFLNTLGTHHPTGRGALFLVRRASCSVQCLKSKELKVRFIGRIMASTLKKGNDTQMRVKYVMAVFEIELHFRPS